jgi:hypothetical protein
LGKEYHALIASFNANPATTAAGVCNHLMSYDYPEEMLSKSKPASDVFTSSANTVHRGHGSRPRQGGSYCPDNTYGGHNGGGTMVAATIVVATTNTVGAPHVAKMVRMVIVINRQKAGMGMVMVIAHPLRIKMSHANFARNMGIPQASVGGATAMLMMIVMMIHVMMIKVCTWHVWC